jgi:hypothetical protein
MRRYRAVILASILGLAASTILSVAPASAKPAVERGEFHEVFTNTFEDFCMDGFTVNSVFVVDGSFSLKSRGRDQLLFYAEHANSSETFTNPANPSAGSVVDKTRVNDKDLDVTDNGDGTLTIVIQRNGPSTLYGPNGKAIARNPGLVRFELVLDHGGTPTDPSDDTEVSFALIKGSTGRTDDYCDAIIAAIG